jgi:hypothetical protein
MELPVQCEIEERELAELARRAADGCGLPKSP